MSDIIVNAIIEQGGNWSANDVVMAYGDIGHAAAAMAGVPYARGISKNMEYKAARRNLERYLKGRKPGAEQQRAMNKAGSRKSGPKKMNLAGKLTINGSEDDTRDRDIDINLDGEDWENLVDLAYDNNQDAINQILADAFGNMSTLDLHEGTADIS